MTDMAETPEPATPAPLRFVARVTIEFTTPFTVRSIAHDPLVDSVFVTDANGLPALPGSSIAGVLRHALDARRFWEDADPLPLSEADIHSLFGAPMVAGDSPQAQQERRQGAGSRLTISWAAIHDSTDRPVDGLLARDRADDPVLSQARLGVLRDHVRIDHRGTADDRGKFEERLVGAGHRFTFELELHGGDGDAPAWNQLLGLLKWPGLRFGAGTRHGFGAFRVVRVRAGTFDLGQAAEFAAYGQLPVGLGDTADQLPDVTGNIVAVAVLPTATATLIGFGPVAPWLFGGGIPTGSEDIAPVTETRVIWDGDRGAVTEHPVHYLPASSLKGALAHRLAWHDNRLAGRWAGSDLPSSPVGDQNPAVRALLGAVKAGKDGEPGRRGALLLDDIFLTQPAPDRTVMHVAIDRFTGGVRAGALFEERVLEPGTWQTDYRIILVDPENALRHLDPAEAGRIATALDATLKDIAKGRLAFGAGGGRGNGGFQCAEVRWCKTGEEWLDKAKAGLLGRQEDAA
ncbi:MAG: hypothetical protein GVY13_12530 [Alphaproteobacteria bacterium]|jgi:hypothetical protein|nr:hypothetical protein [Alphaproteobacteria bacterium]